MSIYSPPNLYHAEGSPVYVRTTMPGLLFRQVEPLGLLLAFAVVLPFFAPAAGARVYTLTTTADDTAANGNCTLREALRAARSDVAIDACLPGEDADTIVLPAGTYSFSGQEALEADTVLEIRGQATDPAAATVDLQGAGRFLAISGSGGAASLTLRGFTVANGHSSEPGGAVWSNEAALILDRMRFVSNHSADLGGAVMAYTNVLGSFDASRTAFLANSAGGRGGGLWVSAAAGAVRLRDLVFQLNSVTAAGSHIDAWAGGLYLEAFSPVSAVVERCEFSQNSVTANGGTMATAAFGGGAYFTAGGGTIRLFDSVFLANAASVAADTGPAQISAFHANAYNGGRVYLDRILVDVSASSYANGSRDVDLFAASGGSVLLANAQVTFGSWNGIQAGATADGLVEVVGTTVADYPSGVGVTLDSFPGGTVAMRNSLLALNGDDLDSLGDGIFLADNCIGPIAGEFPGFVNVPGGNYRLRPTSAAVDAALLAAIAGPFDRDHAPRLVGADPDCGAYESGGLFADGFEAGDTGIWSATTGG
jgi:CSLREA domain-containing protein